MTDKQNDDPKVAKSTMKMDQLAEALKTKSQDMAKKLPVLGHVMWLAMQTKPFQHYFVQDIESRFLAPIIAEQCKLYLQTKAGGLPMGFVSWAFLNEAAEQRYLATQRIAPSDWTSGDRLWLIDVLTPFGGANSVYKELHYEIHKGKDIHVLLPESNQAFKKSTISELMAVRDANKAQNAPPAQH